MSILLWFTWTEVRSTQNGNTNTENRTHGFENIASQLRAFMQVHGERCRKTTTCALRVASLLLSLPLWSVSAFIWFDQLSRIWHAYWYNCHACKSSSCISSLRLHVICTLPTRLFTMYITLHEALSTTTVTYKVWILLQQPLNGFFEFFFLKN